MDRNNRSLALGALLLSALMLGGCSSSIADLPLDTPATVSWWGEGAEVTLGRILVHMTTETQRHAGHADIVRELIDGSVGMRPGAAGMSSDDPDWWREYRDQVEQAAKSAG